MDKKIIGVLVIALIAIVSTVSLSYYILSQSNQTSNIPSPTPTPTPSPSEEPASIPTPSVPEFTLKYVNHSFYEQPTYTIDPYTGEQVIENEGGYIQNDSIEIIIKNPPFTSYRDESGNYTSLYYNVRYKGHYGGQWQTYPMVASEGYWKASQSDYTVVSLPNTQVGHFTAGGQMDFQVQALIGYETVITALSQLSPHELYNIYTFHGTEGSWSNTQTITIP
jgi:hypothetical protein